MTPQQLEVLVADRVQDVIEGRHVEDDRVDFKTELTPDHQKAARQIGGHLNSLRGEDAIWIVGVDESARSLTGLPNVDLATWAAQVESFFEDKPPPLANLVVSVGGGRVRVLRFTAENLPYVVKNSKDDRLEVPWRSATRTRSAHRIDLMRLLVPAIGQTKLDIHKVTLDYSSDGSRVYHVDVLVDDKGGRILFFPTHLVSVVAEVAFRGVDATSIITPTAVTWGRWVATGASVMRGVWQMDPEVVQRFVWAQEDGIYVAGPGALPVKVTLPWREDAEAVRSLLIKWTSIDSTETVEARCAVHDPPQPVT